MVYDPAATAAGRTRNQVASPVDYDAWNRGYMPPSNHRLIHALMYEGAHVVGSSHVTAGEGWWIVIQGEPFACDDNHEMMMFLLERQRVYAKARRAAAVAAGEAVVALFVEHDPDKGQSSD